MNTESLPFEQQYGAKVLLRNPDGLYLFMRRSDIMKGEKQHKWDIPGGRLDTDPITGELEDPIEAINRETHEEARLMLSSIPEHIATQEIDLRARGIAKVIIRQTFIANTYPGPVLLSDEHSEFRWLDVQTALETLTLDDYLFAVLKGEVPNQTSVVR